LIEEAQHDSFPRSEDLARRLAHQVEIDDLAPVPRYGAEEPSLWARPDPPESRS
jgi:hypothetical protein